MTRQLGIDSQTVFGMSPVDFAHLVADLGCNHISTGLAPVPWKLKRFAAWSLRDDSNLRRELIAVMRDRGVSLALAEGLTVRPRIEAADRAADLDLFAALGAERASAVSMEPDPARALDQLAELAELTAQRNMQFVIEFAPPHPVINTLDQALAAVRHIARPNVALLIDTMHLFRSGGSAAQLAALDPSLIGYMQLSDAPRSPAIDDYFAEACFERKCPGEGELPLFDLLDVIPPGVRIGLEVPMHSQLQASADIRQVIRRVVESGRRLLDRTRAKATGH
jgi:sugar phosphate isomerase/epimerase